MSQKIPSHRISSNELLSNTIVPFVLKHKGKWAWQDCSREQIANNICYHGVNGTLVLVHESDELIGVVTYDVMPWQCLEICNVVANKLALINAMTVLMIKFPGFSCQYTHHGKVQFFDVERVKNLVLKFYGKNVNRSTGAN